MAHNKNSRKPRRMPKLELLDRLVALLQHRHGGEEAYARRVKELGAKHGRSNLAADETHFSSMDMVSMELIIEALEQEHIDMGIIKKLTQANTGARKSKVQQQ